MNPVSLDEIIRLHTYLNSIKRPNARVKAAADKVLNHLLTTVEAFQQMTTQPTPAARR
jgi:hypothetical protein